MLRNAGILSVLWGILSYSLHRWSDLRLPIIDWPCKYDDLGVWNCAFLILGGIVLISMGGGAVSPQARLQWRRFRASRRGFISFLALAFLVLLAMLDMVVVGKKALMVSYNGERTFPAFVSTNQRGSQYGLSDDETVNYRALKKQFEAEGKGNFVLMPLIPWDPVLDTDASQTAEVARQQEDGLYHREDQGHPYSGTATQYADEARQQRLAMGNFRRGHLEGRLEAFLPDGSRLLTREYREGKVVEESWAPGADRTAYPGEGGAPWIATLYAPLPPSAKQGHYLGTDSRSWDLAAQIYGGWQVNVQAGMLYLLVTYLVGITLGCTMAYFSGAYDLTMQRIMEIMSNIPFLYLVVILVALVGKDNVTIPVLIGIICLFSWISAATYLRASTYREKERVFVGAAQVIGASHGRIIFRHILPNVLAPIVTLIPFDVSGIIFSLTALSFIGFGLPDSYPSWGTIFDDGVAYLSSPWIASSAFVAMVTVLALITFVGEAIRDAFDPKKFAYYR